MYLLDTNIISDWMRQPRGRVVTHLLSLQESSPLTPVCTSVIVDCELRYGLMKLNSQRLQMAYEETMPLVTIHHLTAQVSKTYANLRMALTTQGKTLDSNDLLIASHALCLNATLVSGDLAFQHVPQLQLENWLL